MDSTTQVNNMIDICPQTTDVKVEDKEKNIDWKNTPAFRHGVYGALYSHLEKACGTNVYGKGRSETKKAYKLLQAYLERSAVLECFQNIPPSHIVKTPPTQEECIKKMTELGNRALKYYRGLPYDQTEVTDTWAKIANTRDGQPLKRSIQSHARVLNRYDKRFIGRHVSAEYTVKDIITRCNGMLAEGHVIAFLNSIGFKCPHCQSVGKIGWCDGVSHRSVDAFRDAVCISCQSQGIITLFEIKTRWENAVLRDRNCTYGGSYVALNTLMAMKANIYLVVASRDTGIVRVGKITSYTLSGNKNWLYALQEGFTWGSPSSFVKCTQGLLKCPVLMPPLVNTLNDDFIKSVSTAVLKNIMFD